MAGIRTVSQLQELSPGQINGGSLFYVSQREGDRFYNRSYALSAMSLDMGGILSGSAIDAVDQVSKIKAGDRYVDVRKLSSDFYNTLSDGGQGWGVEVHRTLKFTTHYTTGSGTYNLTPHIDDVPIATVNNVSGTYLGKGLENWEDPLTSNIAGLSGGGYAKDDLPSFTFRNPSDGTPYYPGSWNDMRMTNVVTIPEKGYATIWGWLADDGNVSPEHAWVGLFVQNKSGNFVPAQFQPWIPGKYSQQLQYVGFSIPVQGGARICIKTGFKVNFNSKGGFQSFGSITYDNFQPCTFVMNIAQP